jgi:hypothetical protein
MLKLFYKSHKTSRACYCAEASLSNGESGNYQRQTIFDTGSNLFPQVTFTT